MAVTIRASKAAKLKNLEVTKIALVPSGSNPKADIAFFKSKRDDTGSDPTEKSTEKLKKTTYNELRAARAASNAMWKVYDRIYDLQDAIYMSAETPEDIPKSIKQFAADVDNILDELASGSYEKADPEALKKAVIEKMVAFASQIAPQEDDVKKLLKPTPKVETKKATKEPTTEKLEDLSKEELIKRLNKATADLADKTVEKSEDEDDEDEDEGDDDENSAISEDVRKTLPSSVLTLLDRSTAAVAKANKTAEDAMKVAKDERERREKGEYITRARTEFAHLPGTPEENGALLYDLYKTMPKDVADKFVERLKAGDAALSTLGEETGSGAPVTGSAEEQLNTMAKKMADDSNGKMSFEKAFTKVCDQNVALYKQYRQETRRKTYTD